MKQKPQKAKSCKWLAPVIIIAAVVLSLAGWFALSPVPGAFVIRLVFDHGGRQTRDALAELTQNSTVQVVRDVNYRSGKRSKMDIYIPESAGDQPLPTVIWTHGGAWISGDKSLLEPYFKLVAEQGFVVVAPNYDLAPGKQYPHQLHQLNAAHQHILDNADAYNIDASKLVLAGDSAGAQISAQLAALIADPSYAAEVGIDSAINPDQLAATVLYSGIYDMQKLARADGITSGLFSWGFGIAAWSYTGTRNPEDPLLAQASPIHYLAPDFPATFISGGNGESLTATQAKPFAAKLQALGVKNATLFFPDDHEPALPHNYQFIMDTDGRESLRAMADFLKSKV
jgi:acetyl esterase/lipase